MGFFSKLFGKNKKETTDLYPKEDENNTRVSDEPAVLSEKNEGENSSEKEDVNKGSAAGNRFNADINIGCEDNIS